MKKIPKQIHICMGRKCGKMAGPYILKRILAEKNMKKEGISPDGKIDIHTSECMGRCDQASNIKIIDKKTNKEEILGYMKPITVIEKLKRQNLI